MDKTTVDLPCKIGDEMYGVRCYRGVCHPQAARVSEMYFISWPCPEGMRLQIVLKHICRGQYGRDVFHTYEECKEECERRNRQ